MADERVVSTEDGPRVKEGSHAHGEASEAAFQRARREAWLTRATALVVVAVLALWVVRGEAISPAPVRYACGIFLCTFALVLAMLLAMRAGHFRMLAERTYLIELHEATTRARHQVLRDHLSGLYSRWFFYERLAEELGRCARYGRIASVAHVSFPDWKTLSLGTQAQLIEQVGYLLQNDLRTSDLAARWGPGRFVWYLPEANAAQAMVSARRLAEAVEMTGLIVGAAQFPVDGSTADELLQAAQGRAETAQAA